MTRGRAIAGVCCLLAVAAAALAVRLPRLAQRPMHGDEANQARKAGDLLETGVYRYDRHEHHGPTLYWLTWPVLRLTGATRFADTSEWQYRLVPVLFAAGLVLLLLLAVDGVGWPAAVLAGVLTAISSAMVFYSRYYIQETLLVFFTCGALFCAWRFVRRPSLCWALVTGVCLGLMHATKETWVLAAAAAALGWGLTLGWTWWQEGVLPDLRPYFRRARLAAVVGAAVLVAVALYSSFGTNPRGPLDSLLCYETYWQRGTTGVGENALHTHAWSYYLQLLLGDRFDFLNDLRRLFTGRPPRGLSWSEGLIMGLAAVGFLVSLTPRGLPESQRPFVRWLGCYTILLTALYAVIPYKTPWCLLSFPHGMILLAGVGGWVLLRAPRSMVGRGLMAVALVVGLVHLGWQSYALNFRFFADQRNPYVYAHTSPDAVNLASRMEELAALAPDGHEMVIHIVTPENPWPLPWYLRRFNPDHVGHWSDTAKWRSETETQPPPSVIILTEAVRDAVEAAFPDGYNRQMNFGLRPVVLLSVYVRQELWDAFLATVRPAD